MSRDYFSELGVRPVINAAGTYTILGGWLVSPEVREAMDYAARYSIRIEELHDAIGRRIAKLIGAPAAMVTCGAASAITLGTAAAITRGDPARIRDLPHVDAEVIIPRAHRCAYDHAIRAAGATLVEVDSVEEIDRAINERTAMFAFFHYLEPEGPISAAAFAEAARKHGCPALIDIAADVPPVENLQRFTGMGFALAAISGGKAIGGPQNSGILFGSEDLIAAARANASPNDDTIGRSMKISKEVMLGLLVALESFLARDHPSDAREWHARASEIAKSLERIPGLEAEIFTPPLANCSPHLRIRWHDGRPLEDAIQRLREGDPPIEVSPDSPPGEMILSMWTLRPGEAKIVAERLLEVLAATSP